MQEINKKAIINEGKSDYKILISNNSSSADKYAGEVLSEYLYKMTNVRLSIVEEIQQLTTTEKYISIGKTNLFKNLKIDFSNIDFHIDGFIQKTVDNTLFLVGGQSDRGTFYAIFDYLEQCLGARFFAVDCEKIPKYQTICLPNLDKIDIPAFSIRAVVSNIYADPDYQLKSRQFGFDLNFDKKYGEMYKDNVWGLHHNIAETIVPSSKYLQTHPEWFYKIAPDSNLYNFIPVFGVKEDGRYDDTMNENPIDIAVESLKKAFLESNAYYLNCSYADCDVVKKVNSDYAKRVKKYTPAGILIMFLNLICERLDKWIEIAVDEKGNKLFPNGRPYSLLVLAYGPTRHAPISKTGEVLVKPNKNITFWLANIQANTLLPINHPKQYPDSRNMFEPWCKITDNLAIWDYYSSFYTHDLYYTPVFITMKENYQYYIKLGLTKFLFTQFNNYEHANRGAICDLKAYVSSKLMWNPDKYDVNELINEFCSYYYGEFCADIVKIINLLNNRFLDCVKAKKGTGNKQYFYKHSPITPKKIKNGDEFFSLEMIQECIDIIERDIELNELSLKSREDKSIMRKRLKLFLATFYAPLCIEHKAYYGCPDKFVEIRDKLFTLLEEIDWDGIVANGKGKDLEEFKNLNMNYLN